MFLLQRKVNDVYAFFKLDLISVGDALKHLNTLKVMLLARNLNWGGAVAARNLSICPKRGKNLDTARVSISSSVKHRRRTIMFQQVDIGFLLCKCFTAVRPCDAARNTGETPLDLTQSMFALSCT